MREKYYKPVFVLTKAEQGLKGSGRSIESWHMFEGLNRCRHLLTKFGGHKMAAGLSLSEENLQAFRETINETSGLTEADLVEKVSIDMQLPFSGVTEEFVKELGILEPYGKGNPKPVFAERQVEVKSARILGKNQNVLKMRVEDTHGTGIDAVYFGNAESLLDYMKDTFGERALRNLLAGRGQGIRMAFTYYPDINEYQGIRTPQIIVQNYK